MSTDPNWYTAKAKFCFCKNNKRIIIIRKGGREVREGEAPMTKVESVSSGTCTCEARAECVRSQDAWPRGVHGTSEEGFLVE